MPLNDIHRLRDVVSGELEVDYDGELPTVDPVEYRGLFVTPQGNGRYHAVPEGHVLPELEFGSDDYDDVLSLVDDLNEAADRLMLLDSDETIEEYGIVVSTGPELEDVTMTHDPDEYRELRKKSA